MIRRVLCSLAFSLLLTLSVISPLHGAIIYVDDSAPVGGNGTSWNTAYKYLQDALAAAGAFDTIRVAQGTYHPDDDDGVPTPIHNPGDRSAMFVLKDDVSLVGAYAGIGAPNPDQRDTTNTPSILSGDLLDDDVPTLGLLQPNRAENCFSVVSGGQATAASTLLDGFTIRDGHQGPNDTPPNAGGAGMFVPFGSSPTIRNCTFTRNYVPSGEAGAAIRFFEENACNVDSCVFVDNRAGRGGAVAVKKSLPEARPTLVACTFQLNVADGAGGGAVVSDVGGSIRLVSCVFENNTATGSLGGGAMLVSENGFAEARHCRFQGNQAINSSHGKGGAVSVPVVQIPDGGPASANVTLVDCSFLANSAMDSIGGGWGGALYLEGPAPESNVINCLFMSNQAGTGSNSRGGAVCLDGSTGGLIQNSLFHGNTAVKGGGIYSLSTTTDPPVLVRILNCTFTQNAASGSSGSTGGVLNDSFGSPPLMANCILWNNVDQNPTTTIQQEQLLDLAPSLPVSVSYTCIQDGTPGISPFPYGGLANGNIDLNPLFVNPSAGNFRLALTSPAIDAGNSLMVVGDTADADEDNNTTEKTPDLDLGLRLRNDLRRTNTGVGDPAFGVCLAVDMGAYEVAYCGTSQPGDLNNDATVDGVDVQPFVLCLFNPVGSNCTCADFDATGVSAGVGLSDIPCFVEKLLTGTSSCEACPALGLFVGDCNANGVPDANDIANGTSPDCQNNFIPDECDLDEADPDGNGQTSADVNANNVPDECEADCNKNSLPDSWELAQGLRPDVNGNGIPDECEPDCNGNTIPDSWDLSQGTSEDCNANGTPDECEQDCNANHVPDDCDMNPADPDGDGVVWPDCNANEYPDFCDLSLPPPFGSLDCNANGIPDECDIASGVCQDANANGLCDACEGGGMGGRAGPGGGLPDGGSLDEPSPQPSPWEGEGSAPSPWPSPWEGEGAAPAADETAARGTGEDTDASTTARAETLAWEAFFQWAIEQEWGPDASIDGAEQFRRTVEKLAELGLPMEAIARR